VIEGEKQTLDTTIFDSLDKYEKPKEVFFCITVYRNCKWKDKGKETAATI
jgi:O-succinylbenzoic acid--CoA ligase